MCMEKCYSKRNTVYRIRKKDKTFIRKQFSSDFRMNNEVNILNTLKNEGANVPRILSIHNKELNLEDLGEVTLLDWLISAEEECSNNYHDTILRLMSFLHDFYRITKDTYGSVYILGDVNLRNFILKDNKIFGIDFELSGKGDIEMDIGKLIAYIVSYDPVATEWKIKFVNDCIHIFSLNFTIDMIKMLSFVEWELKNIEKRRNININIDNIIFRLAEEIIWCIMFI